MSLKISDEDFALFSYCVVALSRIDLLWLFMYSTWNLLSDIGTVLTFFHSAACEINLLVVVFDYVSS